MGFIILQLGENGPSYTRICDPTSKPKSIKLLDVVPRCVIVRPSSTVSVIVGEKIPLFPGNPRFITLGVINRENLSVFLRFCLCPRPRKGFVIRGDTKAAIYDKVGTIGRIFPEPPFGRTEVNPQVCDCERHFVEWRR